MKPPGASVGLQLSEHGTYGRWRVYREEREKPRYLWVGDAITKIKAHLVDNDSYTLIVAERTDE